jgi:hypothetical protein
MKVQKQSAGDTYVAHGVAPPKEMSSNQVAQGILNPRWIDTRAQVQVPIRRMMWPDDNVTCRPTDVTVITNYGLVQSPIVSNVFKHEQR